MSVQNVFTPATAWPTRSRTKPGQGKVEKSAQLQPMTAHLLSGAIRQTSNSSASYLCKYFRGDSEKSAAPLQELNKGTCSPFSRCATSH